MFKAIKKALSKIVNGIRNLFSDENIARAERIATVVSRLTEFALPYAERFAQLTPGSFDDELVAAAARLNKSLAEIMNEPDEDKRRGFILGLVGEATRARLKAEVAKLKGGQLKVGGLVIRVPDDVDRIAGDLFDLAAQAGYTLFVKQRTEQI